MASHSFKLSHSLWGIAALLLIEWLLLGHVGGVAQWLVCGVAMAGSVAMLYISTEIIEEVRGKRHMLILLSALVAEFVVFFAFQYAFLISLSPASFPTLHPDAVSLLLQSTMVFVFNPLYLPGTGAGQALLLVHTLAALGLVLFVLQNVWQFRRP